MNDETATFVEPPPPSRFGVVPFVPDTHYWQIVGNPKVFKAETNTLVATNDAAYTAWLAAGNRMTSIASESELWGVMRTYLPDQYPEWLFSGTTFIQPAVNNYTPAQIRGYAGQKRWETENGGIDFTPRGGPSQGVVLRINTVRESQTAINGAVAAAQQNPAYTTQWKTVDGTFHPLDAATVILIGGSVAYHVQRCFVAEEACHIHTTLSQVDDEFLAVAQIMYPDPAQP
jgi:hypothetical protein